MRWAALFGDLESRLAAGLAAAERDAAWEYAEAERSQLGLGDRLRGAQGAAIRLVTRGGQRFSGVVAQVGADYILLEEGRRTWLIPLAALAHLRVPPRAREGGGGVAAKLGLAHALRALRRAGQSVRVVVATGEVVAGDLVWVGRDHVDVATRVDVVTVAFAAIDAVGN